MGEINGPGARPTGLGPDDRGQWWHRLDDHGMDVWTGSGWMHSPNTVGPQGPIAAGNSITVTGTAHRADLTEAGVEFSGSDAAQRLSVTVPAGQRGPKGPAGTSGAINSSEDFDTTGTLTQGAVFAYNPGIRKFRPQAAPGGTGPWSWSGNDFKSAADPVAADKLIAGTFTIPAQPFDWRPVVHGHLYLFSEANDAQYAAVTVRLLHSEGVVVAHYRSGWSGGWIFGPISPLYGDSESVKTLSPSSTYASVPAGQSANLVVVVERQGVASTSVGKINYSTAMASLVAFAQPL
ncbi:hypothetical protein AB0C65_06530 [Nocardia sp. NPDC048505]